MSKKTEEIRGLNKEDLNNLNGKEGSPTKAKQQSVEEVVPRLVNLAKKASYPPRLSRKSEAKFYKKIREAQIKRKLHENV